MTFEESEATWLYQAQRKKKAYKIKDPGKDFTWLYKKSNDIVFRIHLKSNSKVAQVERFSTYHVRWRGVMSPKTSGTALTFIFCVVGNRDSTEFIGYDFRQRFLEVNRIFQNNRWTSVKLSKGISYDQ